MATRRDVQETKPEQWWNSGISETGRRYTMRMRGFGQTSLYIISNLNACVCLPYASEQGDYSAGRIYPLEK
jgi:hypothetical protein